MKIWKKQEMTGTGHWFVSQAAFSHKVLWCDWPGLTDPLDVDVSIEGDASFSRLQTGRGSIV